MKVRGVAGLSIQLNLVMVAAEGIGLGVGTRAPMYESTSPPSSSSLPRRPRAGLPAPARAFPADVSSLPPYRFLQFASATAYETALMGVGGAA